MIHTRNVTRVFRSATDAEREEGRTWYARARATAETLAIVHGVTVETAAGVLAALSPQKGWGPNVDLAERSLEAREGIGHTGANNAKVTAIIAGAEPLSVLGGDKVRAFYALIVSSGQTREVCVDRHAYSVAAGRFVPETPKLTPRQYDAVAETYRRAARILSRELGREVPPAEVQAVTWVAWRHSLRRRGAFDSHAVTVAA